MNKIELKNILNKLENGVDKFIVAGLFYGLNDSDHREQLLNLKVNMVNLENSTITLPSGRVVVMDEILKEVVTETINQKIYIKMGGGLNKADSDYEFNPYSEYLIKTKPSKVTNNGLSPLSNAGFKKRIRAISDFLTGDASAITPSSLKKDGAYNLLKSQNKKWTIIEAETFLKQNGLSIRRNNLIPMLKEINGGK